MPHILCLDIDGILHPGDASVLLNFDVPAWQIAMQARTQGLFCWQPHLQEALEGSDTLLLIHSTWRRRVSDRALQEILGPDLGSRVIVTDHWIPPGERSNMSHCAYIDTVLQAYQETCAHPCSIGVCVLDDRPNLFEAEAHLLHAWSPTFLWASPESGISDRMLAGKLSDWAHEPLSDDDRTHSVRAACGGP